MVLRRPWMFGDSTEYLQLATNLVGGHGYLSASPEGLEPSALRPVGYPLFLAALFFIHLPIWGVVACQMGLYLGSLFVASRYLIENAQERTFFLAAATLYVFPFVYSVAILSECLTVPMVVLAILSIRRRSPVLAGIVSGSACLARGDMAFLILFTVVAIWWRAGWRKAVLSLSVSILVLVPYSLWNFTTFGEASPLPLATVSGQSLFLATWESKLQLSDLKLMVGGAVTPAARASGFATQVAQDDALASKMAPAGPYHSRQIQIVAPHIYMEAALSRIASDPIGFVAHDVRSLWRLFNTGEFDNIPRLIQWALQAISSAVWILSIAGFLIALIERKNDVLILSAFLVVTLLVPHIPLHTEARYTAASRIPMLMAVAMVVARIWNGISRGGVARAGARS